MGLFLAYLGYIIVNQKSINKNFGILLVVLGALAALYHAHLWYLHK